MAKLITFLHLFLQAGSLVIFPGLAIWALRRGGRRHLGLVTALALGLVVLFALAAATTRFGNRLAPTHGYGYTAPRALALFALTLGLPLVSAALTVHLVQQRAWPGWAAYGAGVGAAAVAWSGARHCIQLAAAGTRVSRCQGRAYCRLRMKTLLEG
jgi:hypothetical protein